MYELVILSFLMRGPIHGYLIAKIINDMIGPFARLSNGRLYPLLAKLEEQGLIVVADDLPDARNDRRQRTFKITEAGRERFQALMMDTTSNPGEYSRIFWYKVASLHLLAEEKRLYLLDHYITFCQSHLFHVEHEMADLERHLGQPPLRSVEQLHDTLRAMRHTRDVWQLELANARSVRNDEETRIAPSEMEGAHPLAASTRPSAEP